MNLTYEKDYLLVANDYFALVPAGGVKGTSQSKIKKIPDYFWY
jgi:hypothetical protein